MRRLSFSIAVILLSNSLVLISSDRASASVSIGVSVNLFHDSLAPYGDWIQTARFGAVWTPRHVDHDWRPYTSGRWVYTDYDWTWVSDDEWGWATDHYGRWTFDPEYGWIWVPGNEWAPAWVEWRSGGGYIGWAPLPPDVDAFHVGYGYRIDPFAYSFVETRHFCEPRVRSHFVPVARNVTFVNVTQNITNYTVVDNRIVNHGLDVQRVERVSGHAVPRVQVREVASFDAARGGHVERGQVAVFRPHEAPSPDRRGDVHAFASESPRKVEHRQEKELRRFDSAEQRERTDLQKIHAREERHPPVVTDDRAFARPQGDDRSRAERRPVTNTGRAELAPTPTAPVPRSRQVQREEPKARPLGQEQVREFHQREVRAQAEHESRERQALTQRQDRERRAVEKAAPAAGHTDDKTQKKQGHH